MIKNEVNLVKKEKKYLLSTLVLICSCLFLFTEKAYADVPSSPDTIDPSFILIFGVIIIIFILLSYIIIKRIKSKNDSNKFN